MKILGEVIGGILLLCVLVSLIVAHVAGQWLCGGSGLCDR